MGEDSITSAPVAIIGPGAIGLTMAHALQVGGRSTILFAHRNPDRFSNGVEVDDGTSVEQWNPGELTTDPARIRECRRVLITTRTNFSQTGPDVLRQHLHPKAMVVSLQNGLDRIKAMQTALPEHDLAMATARIAATLHTDGPIPRLRQHVLHSVNLGSSDPRIRALLQDLRTSLLQGGLPCDINQDPEQLCWRKLVWNIPINGISAALGGVSVEFMMNESVIRDSVIDLMYEVIDIARHDGCVIDDEYPMELMRSANTLGSFVPSSAHDGSTPEELDVIWSNPLVRAVDHGCRSPRLERLHGALAEGKTMAVSDFNGRANKENLNTDISNHRTTVDIFLEAKRKHGSRLAIQDERESLTWEELIDRAMQVAGCLHAHGIRRGEPVMTLMDTGCNWASAFIGVMMAGGMVLSMDPLNPRPRIHKVIEETNTRNILVDTSSRRLAISLGFAEDRIINTDELKGSSSFRLPEPPGPEDLAQAIQTSGSTGRPHIIIHRHATVASNAERQARIHALGPDDRMTMMGSPAVYGPARDLLVAALSGSSVHVWQTPRLGLAGVVPWMRRQDITAMMVVPTIFRGVMSNAPEGLKLPRLRLVLLGGEAARGSDARAVAQLSETADIGWHLASSETGMIAHARSRAVDVKDRGQLPLGKPVPGLQVFLVKSGRVITDSGQVAQLAHDLKNVLVGTMVDGKVVEADSVDIDGRRCWIGSDLLEYDAEENLVFVGRDDKMVKIHGNRINRSEIESALLEHRGIVDAVVSARDHKGELRLHAWYVRRKNTYAYAGELREHLRFRLPASYIPESFIRVDSISRNSGGKVDHSRLTVPDRKNKESLTPGRTGGSRTATMIEIWKHALENEDIGPDTDFHHAGGDSISSINIAFSIERIFGRTIETHIFEQPITPTGVIQFMERGESVVRPLLLDFGDKTEDRKELLFCLTGVGGSIMRYRTLADHFAEDWRVCAVRYPGQEHGRTPDDDVGMIADRLSAEIANRLPNGPIHLVGYCFGGVIAHEMACRLQAMGRTIGRLVLVDAIVPMNDPEIEINRELHGVTIDEKTLLSFMGDDESSVMNTMHQELRWNLSAVRGHVPGVFEGDGLVIRCRQQPDWRPKNAEREINRWANHFVGEVRESVVDIEHLKLMEKRGVESITAAIRTWISNPDSLTLLESDPVYVK